MKTLALLLCSLLLAGCAGNVVVKVPPQKVQEELLAQVEVNDRRAPGIAASTRQAAFGTPMGNITFQPPEAEIIKNLLENELNSALRAKGVMIKQSYVCDIEEFGVNTNTTLLYWDVMGRIRLVLKHGDQQFNLAGEHTERTYVWPGETIIGKVIGESLKQIAAGARETVPQ